MPELDAELAAAKAEIRLLKHELAGLRETAGDLLALVEIDDEYAQVGELYIAGECLRVWLCDREEDYPCSNEPARAAGEG